MKKVLIILSCLAFVTIIYLSRYSIYPIEYYGISLKLDRLSGAITIIGPGNVVSRLEFREMDIP